MKALKIIGVIAIIGMIVGGGVAYYFYQMIYGVNIKSSNAPHELYIKTGSDLEDVVRQLVQKDILKNEDSFRWLAEQMNYGNKIYPGKYLIPAQISNRALLLQLRAGKQTPIKFTINNIRTKTQLAGLVGTQLEADSLAMMKLLNDSTFLAQKQLTKNNVIAIFMADTYLFNWNTSEQAFFDRMYKEYKKFWDEQKTNKAQAFELSPYEVITLASIVEAETNKVDEMNAVAGLYLNRLEIGMALQADPTLKFAVGDFTLKRILNKHKEVDSPYNTYKNPGLPPGPISIPSKVAINAVLNPQDHNYLYMCAKEDNSGYHNFATNLREHAINARKYQRMLDRLNIK